MERKRNKRGIVFLMIGACLIFLAGGWYIYNVIEDSNAGKQAARLLDKIEEQQTQQRYAEDPAVITVESHAFYGTVTVKKLGVELPVFDEWDYTRLKTAPCRYAGRADTNDLIVAAHNYKSHFGNLHQLQPGDEILFSDVYGTPYRYVVKEITTVDGSAVTDMNAGEWDLTLFTCTRSGEQRVTVRCNREEQR